MNELRVTKTFGLYNQCEATMKRMIYKPPSTEKEGNDE